MVRDDFSVESMSGCEEPQGTTALQGPIRSRDRRSYVKCGSSGPALTDYTRPDSGQERAMRVLTREQFHELVWSTPMTTLAKEFGLSGVALHKICRRHDVPTPPRGW